MTMLRPSLTLVLNLDERLAGKETILEIKRNYAHICTPVIRTHACNDAAAPMRNTARVLVGMGTYRYLYSADEGADVRWNEIVEPWIANVLHKVGSTMKAFNNRQRTIGLPEVVFERIEIELQGNELVVSLRTDPQSSAAPALSASVGLARTLLNDSLIESGTRIEVPSDASYEAQYARAWDAWVIDHPEALEPKPAPEANPCDGKTPEAEPEQKKTREQLLQEDIEAKSYENTAVPFSDSKTLPPIEQQAKEEESEQFTFEVDYAQWNVIFADGSQRAFDASSHVFTS